jgi:hypothetical protein
MQTESKFASSFSEEIGVDEELPSSQIRKNRLVQEISAEAVSKTGEPRIDIVSASVFIGMSAQFVAFLFGLVTDIMTRLIDVVLFSVFAGLCVGVIAYALMKGND